MKFLADGALERYEALKKDLTVLYFSSSYRDRELNHHSLLHWVLPFLTVIRSS